MKNRRLLPLLLSLALLGACGDGDAPDSRTDRDSDDGGLTAFQMEHGIGPFTEEVEPGPVDEEMAREGERIYIMNCESCHRMEDRFVGPPLGRVLERRTPTFVLNMIMNPEEMARRHPEGQAMTMEYPLIMPYQNITEEQARAILEYLRTEQR